MSESTLSSEQDTTPMVVSEDEGLIQQNTVIMVNRRTFRKCFGLVESDRCGHFIDSHLSPMVHSYTQWIEYPTGEISMEGHTDELWAMALSKHGRYLYTSGKDTSIVCWDLEKGVSVLCWVAHSQPVYRLALRSFHLASGSGDRRLCVWDARNGTLIVRMLRRHRDSIRSLAFNEEGDRLVSGSVDKSVRIWSVPKGECLAKLMGHYGTIRGMLVIGDLIISGSNDYSMIIWDLKKKQQQRVISDCITRSVVKIAINCDRSLLACACRKSMVIYHWPTMEFHSRRDSEGMRKVDFHPSRPSWIAFCEDSENRVGIMDVESGEHLASFAGHSDTIGDLMFTPDGLRLVTVSDDRTARLWDLSQSMH